MKIKIVRIATILFALFFSLNLSAQFGSRKIFIDPGHDGWGSNDRNVATIPYNAGNTNGFWESSASLRKAIALRDFLQAQGADVKLSRTVNGGSTISLSSRAAAANSFGSERFVSIHSNAIGTNPSTNFLLILYNGTDTSPKYSASKTSATAVWDQMIKNPLTIWTSYTTSRNIRGDQSFYGYSLGVLSPLTRAGFLTEGSFHDYMPECHRLLSPAYCRLEAYNIFRGFADNMGVTLNTAKAGGGGVIAGWVKTKTSMNNSRYAYKSGTDDQWTPVNGARVDLLNSAGTQVASYTCDNNYNGVYIFFDVAPGTYSLRFSASGFQTLTTSGVTASNLNVTANTNTKVFLTPGSGGGTPLPPPPLYLVIGDNATAPYGNKSTTAVLGTNGNLRYLGITEQSPPPTGTGGWISRLSCTLTSSNTNIASIATDGTITIKNPGTVTIKAVGNAGLTAPGSGVSLNGSEGTITLTVTGGTTTPPPNLTLSLDGHPGTSPSIEVGKTDNLSINVEGTAVSRLDCDLSSSNTAVATLSEYGTVVALTAGTTTLKAVRRSDGAQGTLTLTVSSVVAPPPTLSLSLSKSSILIGETATVSITVGGTTVNPQDCDLTGSNTAVASISSNGTITALAAGTSTFTAVRRSDGAKGTSAAITVTAPPVGALTFVVNEGSPSLTVNLRDTIYVGQTGIGVGVFYNGAGVNSRYNFTWSSSNNNIAEISDLAIVAKAIGTVTLKVVGNSAAMSGTTSLNGAEGTRLLTVIQKTVVPANLTLSLSKNPIVIEGTANLSINESGTPVSRLDCILTSEDNNIATVSEYGTVTAVSVGTTTLKAVRFQNGGPAEGSITVTVTPPPAPDPTKFLTPKVVKYGLGNTEAPLATLPISSTAGTIHIYHASGNSGQGAWITRGTPTTYEISNTDVVSGVSEYGTVSTVGAGTATITVKNGDLIGSVTVTVVAEVSNLTLKITGTNDEGAAAITSLNVGSNAYLFIKNANGVSVSRQTSALISSNPNIATISEYGTITAISPGIVLFTAINGNSEGNIALEVTLPTDVNNPKREMRAAWIAAIGIDWPTTKISSTGNTTQINQQKNLMIRMLDSIAAINMNAVYFQVRTRCDAMYNSAYEPWSSDLVSTRGMNPGYDPLQFVLDEAHKRGIEVHAWINPFRFESTLNQWAGQQGNYKSTNPTWVMTYPSGYSMLNPGVPEVRKRIKDIVGDIINKYNVDGIVFDDYFYSYDGTSNTLDQAAQNAYKPSSMSIAEWRRKNINDVITAVYDTIQAKKPYVTFGVAPFGIWTTSSSVATANGLTLPSGITGLDAYGQVYCDPVAWMKAGKVDYISPQIYWAIGKSGQQYEKLCPWWSGVANKFGKHFYASQKIASFTASEIGSQIGYNRSSTLNAAPGSVFFSISKLLTAGYGASLRSNSFSKKALPPAISWKSHPVYTITGSVTRSGTQLSWTAVSGVTGGARYSVYAVPNAFAGQPGIACSTSQYLLGMAYTNSFTIPLAYANTNYTFIVGLLDRYGNEYLPSQTSSTGGLSLGFSSIPGNDPYIPVEPKVNIGGKVYLTIHDGSGYISRLSCTLTSSNPEVATIDANGMITGVGVGTITIKAIRHTDGSGEGIITLTVVDGSVLPPPDYLTLYYDPALTSIDVGNKASTFVKSSGGLAVSRLDCIWTSSNEDIATVSEYGTVTGIAPGTATITAIGKAGAKTTDGSASVAGAEGTLEIIVTGQITPPPPAVLTLSLDKNPILIGGTAILSIKNADNEDVSRLECELTSSNDAIASISEWGTITGNSAGTVTIKAVRGNVEGTIAITVTKSSATGPMVGTYLIGTQVQASPAFASPAKKAVAENTTDFTSLSDAVTALNTRGLGGNVVFEITSNLTEPNNIGIGVNTGAYSLTIRPDKDANRLVSFTSITVATAAPANFVIGYPTSNLGSAWSASNAIPTNNIIIDGCAEGGSERRLAFINNSGVSTANSVVLGVDGNCQGVTIQNCIITNQSTGATPVSCACIGSFVRPTTAPSNLVINNNALTSTAGNTAAGFRQFLIGTVGSPAPSSTGFVFKNNYVSVRHRILELNYSNGGTIQNNVFSLNQTSAQGTILYGLFFNTGLSGTFDILGNKFTQLACFETATGAYGLRAISLSGGPAYNIFNNSFAGLNRSGGGTLDATYIFANGTANIIHNAFYMPQLTSSVGYYYAVNAFTTGHTILNNIFISDEPAVAHSFVSGVMTGSGASDYNVYYLRKTNANAKIVGSYASLTDYRTANPTKDVNSIYKNVEFVSATDLRLAGESAKDPDLGVPRSPLVLTDMFGNERGLITFAGSNEASNLNLPTGRITPKIQAIDIYATKTGIAVQFNGDAVIELYTVNGILIEKTQAYQSYFRDLDKGVYIVRVNGQAKKFVK